ncbi:MAG: tetratricopeptide repeat protein, partial [Acidobacteriota bacterium]
MLIFSINYHFSTFVKDVLVLGLMALLGICCSGPKAYCQGMRVGLEPSTAARSQPIRVNLGAAPMRMGLIEQGQRLGVQQVGEAVAEASRQLVARPAISGPEALVLKADRLVGEGKISPAVEIYRKAIDMQARLLSAHIGLGYALIKMGEFAAAANYYRKALALSPQNSEVQLNLGVACYRSGNIVEAITQYQQAIAQHKGPFPAAHFNLAMAYAHQSNFTAAIDHYQTAIRQRDNKYPEAHNNLGLIYEVLGENETATKHFHLAIEQQRGRYALAHYNLARLYQVVGKFSEAAEGFQLAIKYQPDFPEAYLDLGNLYLIRTITKNSNELELAITTYQKALKLRNNIYPLAHENLAIALTKKGELTQALEEFRIAYDQNEGESPETLQNLITAISDQEMFIIGNELSRLANAGNLKQKRADAEIPIRFQTALDKYDSLEDK